MFELGPILSHLFQAFRDVLVSAGVPTTAAYVSSKLIQTTLLVTTISLVPMVLVYAERKISAFMQARLGPMHVGPYGILQTLADGVKLMFKEDIIPIGSDRFLHTIAPIIACAPAFVCFAPIPYGIGFIPVDLDAGLLFIFAISGVSSIAILVGGWASANKFSMIGGIRGAAQVVSYEIPRVLAVVPVVMWYGSQNLRVIAEGQQTAHWFGVIPHWFIFYPVIGQISFLIFLIASVAETNRTPFDLPEAESELVAGFHTEFSGLKFALFFLAEYAYVFLSSLMITALFLGGGDSFLIPDGIIPSWIWVLIKTGAMIFIFLWFRWTFPRLRVDRLMQFCWQFLLPWSIINILFTGGVLLARTKWF